MRYVCLCLAIVLLLVAIPCLAADKTAEKKGDDNSPETALQSFFVAVLFHDRDTVKQLAAPLDEKEMAWLFTGEKVPDQLQQSFRDQIQKTPIKRLKAGDVVPLPGNRTYVVTAAETAPGHVMLQLAEDPIPYRLAKVDGKWQVEAGPLVAARKAAEASRQKQQKAGKKQ